MERHPGTMKTQIIFPAQAGIQEVAGFLSLTFSEE
jgi:hypothetical protein